MVHPRREFIFGDLRPFAQCHAGTLCENHSHDVILAWFGGTREGADDVGIWASSRSPHTSQSSHAPNTSQASRSHDMQARSPGEHWTAPRRIAKVSDEPHWNPVLYALTEAGQDLVLQFKVGKSIRSWVTWIAQSCDGGETWQSARPLDLADTAELPGTADLPRRSEEHSRREGRGGRGPVRNKPIRLASGDWLAGASTETWKRWDAFFDRSPSGVDQWRATEYVRRGRSAFSGKGLIQPTLWESEPGYIHALFRSTNGWVYRSDSRDDGKSFCPAYPTAIPNNNSGIDLARLGKGGLALVCNPVAGNWADRTPLSILFSWDNGASWPRRIEIETEPGEFSYPAVIAVGPEREDLALTYTWNRRRMAYLRIPARELPVAPAGDASAPHS